MSTQAVLDAGLLAYILNHWYPSVFVIVFVVVAIVCAMGYTFGANPLEPDTEIEALVEPKRFVGGLDVADRMKVLIDQQNGEQEQEILTRVRVRCTSEVPVPRWTDRS